MIDWVCVERLLRRRLSKPTIEVGTGRLLMAAGRPLLGHELLAAASLDQDHRQELVLSDIYPGRSLSCSRRAGAASPGSSSIGTRSAR